MITQVSAQPRVLQTSLVASVETIMVGRSGFFEVMTDGGVTRLGAGDVVVLTRGTKYSVTAGATPSERLDILNPPDVELLEAALHHEHEHHGFE